MLNQNKQPAGGKNLMDLKPGSEPSHANLPHDFGANVQDTTERDYASHAARSQDPGREQTRSSDERGGRRDAGVGVNATNAGAGSGGDLDTSEIGLDGRGLAEHIPDQAERDRDGPDRTDGLTSAKKNDHIEPLNANDDVVRGGTVTYERDTDAAGSTRDEGADALNTTANDDPYQDAAVGEISRGESAGPADSSSSSARK